MTTTTGNVWDSPRAQLPAPAQRDHDLFVAWNGGGWGWTCACGVITGQHALHRSQGHAMAAGRRHIK